LYGVTDVTGAKAILSELVRETLRTGAPNSFPGRFADALGYGSADLSVTRAATTNTELDLFRAIDIPTSGQDYIVFLRQKDRAWFFRVDSMGRTKKAAFGQRSAQQWNLEPRRATDKEAAEVLSGVCSHLYDVVVQQPRAR
jgi:hypothetical protein